MGADALLSARECADRRDIAGARRGLESQKAKIAALKVAAVTGGLVERLAHDLAVVLEGLANEDAYRARGRQWMTSKMMGHQMQRCMEDSDSDEEETSMPRLMGSVGRARRLPQHEQKIIQGSDDARDVSPKAFCASTYKRNLVATDIFSSAGAGAPPRPLLVPLSQKSSSARGPGPRRVIALEPHPHSIRIANKTFPF